MKYGFWHLGRFSGYYHDLFGEYPSRTVAAILDQFPPLPESSRREGAPAPSITG